MSSTRGDRFGAIRHTNQTTGLQPIQIDNNVYFDCLICDSRFTSRHYLSKHKSRTHRLPKFECDSCRRLFKTRSDVRRHQNVHKSTRNHICNQCNSTFKSIEHLQNHRRRTHSLVDIRNICDQCDQSFKAHASLYRHYQLKHLDKVSITCNICQSSFASNDALRQHLKRSANNNNINTICDICEKLFTRDQFQLHYRQVHMRDEYKCQLCADKLFANACRYRQHVRLNHNQQQRIFKCDQCEKTTNRASELYSHINIIRFKCNDRHFVCEICTKTFRSSSNLKDHIEYCHSNNRYKCDHCNKWYRAKQALRQHKRSVHLMVRFDCDQCDKTMKTHAAIIVHIRKWHSVEADRSNDET
jgi:KRAB domain-containing zinc finger protein